MSNSERATTTITTTSGREIVMKTYITGKEMNEIKARVLFGGVTTTGETGEKAKIPLEKVLDYDRAQLEALLISFDGSAENPIAAIEELPSAEYDDAVKKIKETAGISLAPAK